MLRALAARLYRRVAGGDGEDDDPAAFSLLDRSVNEAHGGQTDAGQRAIRNVQAKGELLEDADERP